MSELFRDLDNYLVDKPIRLPIGGKVYEFPGSISQRTGLILERIAAGAAEVKKNGGGAAELAKEAFSDEEEVDLRLEVMGEEALQRMADGGLTSAQVKRVFQTLLAWHMLSPEAAKEVWEDQGEAPAPNRAARRGSKGSASTTKRPASTSGTTTRKPAAARKRA